MKKIIKEIYPYIIIIIVVVLIRSFIITPVIVKGTSMEPNLKEGEMLLLSKINYKVSKIERFDVVVVNVLGDKIIKRVIGLPGESVEYKDNVLYINEKKVKDNFELEKTKDFTLEDVCSCSKIPKDKYLVLGDNRSVSADSRYYGLIDKKDIEGQTIVRLWPLNKISLVK